MIREAVHKDIDQIIDVHLNAFDGFFLTSLGEPFLRELYGAFIASRSGILRVSCNSSGNVVGFSAGTLDPQKFFFQLKIKRGWRFLFFALPSFIRRPAFIIKKLYGAIFYKGDTAVQLHQAALLSSLAVKTSYSGKATGKRLLADFEQQVRQSESCDSVYLITDYDNNCKVIDFYSKIGYEYESDFCQANNRRMLRLVKPLN